MSSLLPWTALLEGFDFFIFKVSIPLSQFKHYDPAFTFTLSLQTSSVLVQFFGVFFTSLCSVNCRIYSSILLLAILLVIIPISSAQLPEDLGFILAVIWVTLMGLAMGLLQMSLYGMVGWLPREYTVALMTGVALSGVVIGTTRIVTLLFWSS